MERFIRISRRSKADKAKREWFVIPNCEKVQVWDLVHPDRRLRVPCGILDGVSRGCRVSYLGKYFDVVSVENSTRLRGIEILCRPASEVTSAMPVAMARRA